MNFKLGKKGYYRSPRGTLKIAISLPEGVNEICQRYEATSNLTPTGIVAIEWLKSLGEMTMKEFIQKRKKTKRRA